MSTHKKILTITGAVISLALLLALPLMNGFKSSLYSTLADPQPIPPVVPLTDGDVNSDNDNFSSDVDIDGDYAIVGAWNDSSNGYYQNGAAYIFYNNPSDNPDMGWVQQAKLTGPGYYSYFGFSVGIDAVNGRAIVGAYNSVQGIVRIYEKDYNGTNSWGQRAQTNCPDGNLGFGRWVDIDGDYAVVSNDYYNSSTGRAYILKKDYNPGNPGVPLPNNWGVYKTLSVGNSNSYFGSSVAIDGNNIIIGERYYLNTTYPWYPGRVYIYHKDYTCPQSDCWGNGSPMSYFQGWYGYDNLGVDVDIDGDYAIAGTNGNQYAYIYRYNSGMDNWFQETNIYRPEYYFGKGVSIQDSGQGKIYAAIGTGNSNVYMYSGDGYGNWNEKYLIGTNYYPLNGNWGGISISDKYVIYGNYSYSSDGAAFIAGYMEATCGNQIIERPAESCDDGNTNDNDGCSSTCWNEVCGDGVKVPIEGCDDGNLTDGDGCASTCQPEVCGDGIKVPIEECDDGGESATCNKDCTLSSCGDGSYNVSAGETCDDGNIVSGDGCNSSCGIEYCGDGVKQTGLGEQCDDGNNINGDGCDSDCFTETCGNGIMQAGETCDDGNHTDGDGCSSACQATCGDRIVVGAEECDDGNAVSGDGCSSACMIETGEWGKSADLGPVSPTSSFGHSVSIDGDYAVVGDGGLHSFYIFKKDGSAWSLVKEISDDDINAEGIETSNIGLSVAISGDYIIAADGEDGGSNVLVFYRNQGGENNWGYQAPLLGSDGLFQLNWDGNPLSISGNYIIVGSYNANGEQDYSGAAYVFGRGGANWYQRAKLTASDGADGDQFGISVAISGDYAIIGADGKDTQSYGDVGAAYIFKRDGLIWNQQAKITHSDQNDSDNFGHSVDIDGDYAVIGAPPKRYGAYDGVGAAYVFKRTNSSWAQQAKLMAGDWNESDIFGFSVSISGKRAVIGAVGKEEEKGAAYAFERTGANWSQSSRLTASMGGDRVGYSVSFDGLYTIVGAPGANNGVGVVHIYDFRPLICGDGYVRGEEECDDGNLTSGDGCTASCLLEYCGDGIDNNGGAEQCDDGNSVDGDGCSSTCQLEICGDGKLMGDEECDDGNKVNGDGCSAACEIENGQWNTGRKIYSADGQDGYNFGGNTDNNIGGAIDIDGDYAIVGAPFAGGARNDREGAAYMFKKNAEGNWEQEYKIYANDGQNDQRFGTGVSISGDTAVIGAPNAQGMNDSNEGATYIYKRTNDLVLAGTADVACDVGSDGSDGITSAALTGAPRFAIGSILTWTSGDFKGRSFEVMDGSPNPGDCPGGQNGCAVLRGFNVTSMSCPDTDTVVNGWTFEVRRLWTPQAKIFSADGMSEDMFGASVSIDGDYTAIGAPRNNEKGAAYVFKKTDSLVLAGTADVSCDARTDGSDAITSAALTGAPGIKNLTLTWTSGDFRGRSFEIMLANPDPGECPGGENGCAALNGFNVTSVVCGEGMDDVVNGWTFEVHENWSQQGKLTGSQQGDQVGRSVSISGDRVLVGAPFDSTQAERAGTAYIFKRDGSDWSKEAVLTRGDPGIEDYFGWSVSLEDNYAVIGTPGDDVNGIPDKGSAYVFKHVGANWNQTAKLTASNPGDRVGWSVSLSGKRAILGAMGDSENRGAAYIFERNGDTWTKKEKFTAVDGVSGNLFGFSVAVDGVNVGIGAPGARSITDNTGAAYMFAYKTVACGDGLLWGDEQCDDGNIVNGDGCSATCQVEGVRFEYAGNGTEDDCDPIENNVCLWRDTEGPVYNVGQAEIEWACGQCSTAENYTGLAKLAPTCFGGGLANIPGHYTCMHVTDSDSHYNIYWTGWDRGDGQGGGSSGAFSYVRKIYDVLAPDAISDLNLADNGLTIGVDWAAPADNGGGKVARYDLRYSTSPITEENWGDAEVMYIPNLPLPAKSEEHSDLINTLAPGTYYFAMRSYDDSGNLSDLSNVFELVLADDTPVITNVDPTSSVNDTATPVTITGRNFLGDTKDQVHFISNDAWFFIIPSGGTTTQLDLTVPAGVLPGEYKVRVNNRGGMSSEDFTFTVNEATANKLPVVTNIIPSYGYNATDTAVTIYGRDLTGATDVELITPAKRMVVATLTDVHVVSDTELTATVPSGIGPFTNSLYVIVTTPNGKNYSSAQKFIIGDMQFIDAGTVEPVTADSSSGIDLSGFSSEPSTTLNADITLKTAGSALVSPEVLVAEIRADIPSGTTITDSSGAQYLGRILPPRLVNKEEALGSPVYDQLTDDSVIFEMGNPDESIYFNPDIVVTISMTSPVTPIVWYYNQAEDKFELAGKDGVKDGITYIPGGTVLSHVGDSYTVGILTDHMSSYVIGVTPTITNITPSSGVAGTPVTITGTNFHSDATVTIGGMPATKTWNSTTSISAVVPGLGAGPQAVTVTNPDHLSAASSFTVTVAGGTQEYVPTGGGGGGGGSSALLIPSDSNTKTSSTPSILRQTANEDKVVTRPLQIGDSLFQTEGSEKYALLTGANGAITIKPNKDSSVSLAIPGNTTVTGATGWDGIINPPLIRSVRDNISITGDDIKDVSAKLYRGDVNVVIEGGSPDASLRFSSPVTIEIPVTFPNGTLVDIFRRPAEGGAWEFINTKTVADGKVSFETSHLSLFAIARADASRRATLLKPSALKPAAPTVKEVVTQIVSMFKDIKNHWAEAYINRLYAEGIVSGKTATKFAPNDPVSRAEVLKIALNTFNYKIPSRLTYDPFPDVKMTDWVAPYAQVAKEQGILKGFPEGMRPNELVSRAEALKILLTASKLPLESTSAKNFTDTSPGAWYMYYVRYAFENGIIGGYSDGSFRPSATITRAEIAKITVKIMDMAMGK